MLTSGIDFINFKKKKINSTVKKKLLKIIIEKNQVLTSLRKVYKNSYKNKSLNKYKKYKKLRVIGMGGSTLGTQSIFEFLKHKIKKEFQFIDNLQPIKKNKIQKKYLNLIISKSGNTVETIVNANILIKKKDENILLQKIKKTI